MTDEQVNTGKNPISEEEDRKQVQVERGILRGLIDGTLLTRKKVMGQMPFVFFLAFLGMLYISNSYHAESLKRKREKYREEINELRSKAVYVSSELMKLSRQTVVAEEIRESGLDLRESVVPPKKIIVKESRKYKQDVP